MRTTIIPQPAAGTSPAGDEMGVAPGASCETIEPATRGEWRQWLAGHHESAREVWLVWHRKQGPPEGISLTEAMSEALCFGWVDSRLRPIDQERSALRFTPRSPAGGWSQANKRRIDRLMADGLMTEAGRRVVEAARHDGSWEAPDAVGALRVPQDFADAMAANELAGHRFKAFPPSTQKVSLWWVCSAKQAETRALRIAQVVRLAAQNKALGNRPCH